MVSVNRLIELLKSEFPNAWFREGWEFSKDYEKSVWTGEGSYIDKDEEIPMFNYYSSSEDYMFGAHRKLNDFVEANGYYVECHDAGTFFIFPQ